MKKAAITLASLFWAASAFAQYSARDVKEAVRMLQETQRMIEPAVAAVRDQAAVLSMLAAAEKQLKESQPASSFDDANKVIDDFAQKRRENDPLSRELERTIASARQILGVYKPILNVAEARTKLHHDVIHPLQREAIRNAGDLQQLTQQLQFMQMQSYTRVLPEILNAVGYASTDAPR
ncbi:MAG TPA: hypothetical protein VLU46_16380 [Thermoanaerobaculia bacterium]|nr:hypothetical protein [Thermoanaerobaculia bacterium]